MGDAASIVFRPSAELMSRWLIMPAAQAFGRMS
jgi:hypothetical protein